MIKTDGTSTPISNLKVTPSNVSEADVYVNETDTTADEADVTTIENSNISTLDKYSYTQSKNQYGDNNNDDDDDDDDND